MDATRGPILFRCDGTAWDNGREPLLPMSLARQAALQRRRRGTHFLSTSIRSRWRPSSTAATTTGRRLRSRLGGRRRPRGHLAQVRKLNAAAVVVAGERDIAGLPRELKKTGALVMAFDSTAELLSSPCRPGGEPAAPTRGEGVPCRSRAASSCSAPVRRSAVACSRRQRNHPRHEPPTPFRALVAMGDDDLAARRSPERSSCSRAGKVARR